MSIIEKIPVHVGIIMDGNGRWAQMRGLPRIEGHRVGAERAKEIIEGSLELGIKYLTLYTFSTENWQRPVSEISMLMRLLELYLRKEISGLLQKGIAYKAVGELWRLPKNIQALIRETEEKTAEHSKMTLITALSYSGRSEIVRAVNRIVAAGAGEGEITEEKFGTYLDTSGVPDPDLIIRTSGERRLSNFLLWQGAYAELYFSETLWPDFDKDELKAAIKDYQGRERRFGAVSVKSNAS